jgi:hypothetical protein
MYWKEGKKQEEGILGQKKVNRELIQGRERNNLRRSSRKVKLRIIRNSS